MKRPRSPGREPLVQSQNISDLRQDIPHVDRRPELRLIAGRQKPEDVSVCRLIDADIRDDLLELAGVDETTCELARHDEIALFSAEDTEPQRLRRSVLGIMSCELEENRDRRGVVIGAGAINGV